MQHTESRERSAEVLRAALALMGQHDAAFNPLAFAVFYEHVAGINARLSQAIEASLRTEPRLGDATIARLYREHVNDRDEAALQQASGQLERLMSGMVDRAALTGERASLFGQTLGSLKEAPRTQASPGLEPAINRALDGTTEMKQLAAELQRQLEAGGQEIERLRNDLSRARDEALFDALTRGLNRRGFDQKRAEMLARVPAAGRSHGLVMFDIGRFKAVNDTYGHVMGDRVLQAVAEVLRASLSDPSQCVARYGGEEFAMLLPDCDRVVALPLAETSRVRVKALRVRDRRTQNVMLTVTLSAGVAFLQPGEDAQRLTMRADQALYAAKQAGRDRVKSA
ncbi:MAG: GGDEF domain-containing protein [Pseudomonadota bacterium]